MKNKDKAILQKLMDHQKTIKNFYEIPFLQKNKNPNKKDANKFFLWGILNYQMQVKRVTENAKKLSETIFGNTNELWDKIAKDKLTQWNNKYKQYSIHKFPKAHERVWRIGREIVKNYHGDARDIWKGQRANVVLKRLTEMRVGKQLSRFICKCLIENKIIKGSVDVKADSNILNVIGRVYEGKSIPQKHEDRVISITRRIYPQNPSKIDLSLYDIGKQYCKKTTPKCAECPMRTNCDYYRNHKNKLL
jgi:endonuclease III